MTETHQQGLCEVILNVVKGTYYIKRLSPHQQVIHKLSSKTVKKSVKRKLLLQQNTIIPILIKPALSVLNNV